MDGYSCDRLDERESASRIFLRGREDNGEFEKRNDPVQAPFGRVYGHAAADHLHGRRDDLHLGAAARRSENFFAKGPEGTPRRGEEHVLSEVHPRIIPTSGGLLLGVHEADIRSSGAFE